jgi:exoribonuclease II
VAAHANGSRDEESDYFQRALKINPNMDGVAQNIEVLKQFVSRRRGRII